MIDLTTNGSSTMIEDDDLNLTATIEEGDHCAHCGDTVAEYVTGWEHDTTGDRWCNDLTDEEAAEDDDATAATPAPVAPGNWAGVTIEPDEETTQVEISVGDPRGCFTMALRRVRDSEGRTRLFLRVPHPEDSTPHAPMREVYPGYYEIG